jgi:prolyl-tRNA synthetase
MKRSQLFTKTSKTAPADEVAKNAQLLIRAGFVHKEMAGVYAYLPLGKRVLDKIIEIIRQEMNAIGGQEIGLTALQSPETWQKSGRWRDEVMDVWFKTRLKNNSQLGLAPTHEEPLTLLMKNFISSYRDLPVYPYQFQIKFRNEPRPKSGLMRGREFLMKDLYSFSVDLAQHQAFYDQAAETYQKIFDRLGLGEITYKTFASGGSFAKFSHEFQTVSPVGEDTIYISDEKRLAVNEEVLTDEVLAELKLNRQDLRPEKAVEVGNIFTLGAKYSEALGLVYTDEHGQQKPVFMGSYGIGPTRLMGLIAEHFADEKGLVWPDNIAPLQVYLINVGPDENVVEMTTKLYDELNEKGIEVLWDDRDVRPGEKFADAELIGIPHRVVVSPKLLAVGQLEYKSRTSQKVTTLTDRELFARLGR